MLISLQWTLSFHVLAAAAAVCMFLMRSSSDTSGICCFQYSCTDEVLLYFCSRPDKSDSMCIQSSATAEATPGPYSQVPIVHEQQSQAEVLALYSQGIAEPGGQGRVASALACLQVLPCEKGHYYYQLIKHYCQKRNLNALKRIQSALTGDDRWQTFQQVPVAPW